MNYTPSKWYWLPANRSAVVFSAPAAAYVDPNTDGGYASFTNNGNVATPIATDGELASVLANAGLAGPLVLSTQPTDWGAVTILDIIAAVGAAGVVVTSTGTSAISAHYQLIGEPMATMGQMQIYINAHSQFPNNAALLWSAYDKAVTFSTTAQFTAVYQGLQDYYQGWKTWAYHAGTMPAWGAWTIA
jgi:hypothetical protein